VTFPSSPALRYVTTPYAPLFRATMVDDPVTKYRHQRTVLRNKSEELRGVAVRRGLSTNEQSTYWRYRGRLDMVQNVIKDLNTLLRGHIGARENSKVDNV